MIEKQRNTFLVRLLAVGLMDIFQLRFS